MKCIDVQSKLTDLLFKDLDDKMESKVLEHLRTCDICSKEKSALENILNIAKKTDSYIEPQNDFWESFDNRFEQRLEMESRRVVIERIPEKSAGTVYKLLAFAASLLIIIIASSIFTDSSSNNDIAKNDDAAMNPIEVLGVRTEKYFDDARKLLFNILYTETGEDSLIDITLEKEYATKLLKESRYLQTSLPDAKQPELVYLVNQLESILLQIAHLEAEENAPEVEIVQDGIRKNAILMKINLHKINQLLEESRKQKEQKKMKSNT